MKKFGAGWGDEEPKKWSSSGPVDWSDEPSVLGESSRKEEIQAGRKESVVRQLLRQALPREEEEVDEPRDSEQNEGGRAGS